MSGETFDLAVVDELIGVLHRPVEDGGAGIGSVSGDPSDVNPPGVFVRVDGIVHDTFAGATINTTVFLVVGDQDHRRALAALAELHDKALAVIDPDGPITTVGLILPSNPAPLPALAVPVNLPTPQEPAP